MHLYLEPVPQFASLTCSVDAPTQDSEATRVFWLPMIELTHAVSPFATISSNAAREILNELHEHISPTQADTYEIQSNPDLDCTIALRRNKFKAKYDKFVHKQQSTASSFRTFTPTSTHGYFVVFVVVNEPSSLQRLTSILLQRLVPASTVSIMTQSSQQNPIISSWVLSLCLRAVSFGSIPIYPAAQTFYSRFMECYHILAQLPAHMGTVSPPDQISYLQAVLMSILLDDKYVKMKEADLVELNPEVIRNKTLLEGVGIRGSKMNLSGRILPNLVLKRDKSKGLVNDGETQLLQSTALISTFATSAEVAKIAADQSQVLSFSEQNVNFKGFYHKEVMKNDKASKTQIKALQKVRVDQGRAHGNSRNDAGVFKYMEPDDDQNSNVVDDDKTTITIGTSMSAESSIHSMSTASRESSAKVPTLQGSSRDSSSIFSNQRKNKLLSAVAASKQERIIGLMNGSSNSSSLPSPLMLQRINASPRDHPINSIRGSQPYDSNSHNFNPFVSSPEGRTDPSSKGLDSRFTANQKVIPMNSAPTNHQVVVTFAINEDLTYNIQNSSLVSSSIQGVIQVQAMCKSDFKGPILVALRDPSGYIQMIDRLSPGVKTNSVRDGVFLYNVALPQWKEYLPIIKYKCNAKLKPDPLRVQSRSIVNGSKCQIDLMLVANAKNRKSLTNLKITLILSKNTARCISMKPSTGKWTEGINSIEWIMGEIRVGETVKMQAQVELRSVSTLNDSQEFSLQVVGECHSVQLTDIEVLAERGDELQVDISNAYARRFRLFYKEQVGNNGVQQISLR